MNAVLQDPQLTSLEGVCRPLLQLAQQITGLETTFVTSIDWDGQSQEVLFALNTGRMQLPEGSCVDWHESMCRSLFLSGLSNSSAVGVEVPATQGAKSLGIKTFVAVPILLGDLPIGTVCGASESAVVLGGEQVAAMELIAEALQQLLGSEREKVLAQSRAERAEREAGDARLEARQHAMDYQQMEFLAHTDVLTGLPNRRAFMRRWEEALVRSGREKYPIGLMLIDADHFKSVNDSMGHPKGDAVLRAIGATLLVAAHSPDLLARLGGDEFALVTTHTDGRQLAAVAENIQQLFGTMAAELGVATTLSIGLVCSDDCPRERMLADADQALYRSKAAGGNTIQGYTNSAQCAPSMGYDDAA